MKMLLHCISACGLLGLFAILGSQLGCRDYQAGPLPSHIFIEVSPPTQPVPAAALPTSCSDSVEVTWLGVTNYVVRYPYQGRMVSIFLDHQLNANHYTQISDTLGIVNPDLVVIGHDHFDHTGECTGQGDLLCGLALLAEGSPEADWSGWPISSLPDGDTAGALFAPQSVCDRSSPTPCYPVRAENKVQTYTIPKLGLRLTTIPSSHSLLYGEPNGQRAPSGESATDSYTYLLQFPAARELCRPSLLWANSTIQMAPYLNYTELLETPTKSLSLNYKALLEDGLRTLGQRRVGLWTFYAYDLPGPDAMRQWSELISPLSWTNHHHGVGASGYFPDLHRTFEAHSLGGPLDKPAAPWLPQACPDNVKFLPLKDYWTSFDLSASGAVVNQPRSAKFREDFRQRIRQLEQDQPATGCAQ